jgi:putative phage-type endonuclease
MKIIDFPQGSAEWLSSRAGKVTASKIADVMAKGKSGEAADRKNYRAQIVAEILTGKPQDSVFMNDAMKWGVENEPFARAAYEVATETMVDQVGLVLHPNMDRAAASPDGLVGKVGLVEIKCPNTATHIEYLLSGQVPSKYRYQMLWQMACTERQWCDFTSFDPRLRQDLQLFVVRLIRDDDAIAAIEAEVTKFLSEVDETIQRLTERKAA